MIIFEYKVSPAWLSPGAPESIFRITVTSDKENNVITWFHDKKYLHTIPTSEINKIKSIIKEHSELFRIPGCLEPNTVLDGEEYSFIFSDGKNTNSFSGFNILDYGRSPRKNATLALRVARTIKEKVLDPSGVRTMIPTRLQHWPKYRKPSNIVKI
jgi:hypothetical protein